MDFRGLDLNLIVAFDALMAERHVTRAAVRLGLTQPAMSAALARLRRATGDELFVRGREGLAPTPRAKELVGPLREALTTVADALALRDDFRPDRTSQVFTLALSDHPAHRILPDLVAALARDAPGVDLRVRGFRDRREVVELLDAGLADAAVSVSPGREARILSVPLLEESFVCIARRGSASLAAFEDPRAFAGARHVLVSPEGDEYGVVDEGLAELGLDRRLGVVLPHMYAVPALVARTDMVATLMAGVVEASGLGRSLVSRPPPLALPTIAFHLLWHRRTDAHPAHEWFREQLLATCLPSHA